MPCSSRHPLPDLALGLQVGRALLESPKVLAYIIHLGGGREEGGSTDECCWRNTQGRKLE